MICSKFFFFSFDCYRFQTGPSTYFALRVLPGFYRVWITLLSSGMLCITTDQLHVVWAFHYWKDHIFQNFWTASFSNDHLNWCRNLYANILGLKDASTSMVILRPFYMWVMSISLTFLEISLNFVDLFWAFTKFLKLFWAFHSSVAFVWTFLASAQVPWFESAHDSTMRPNSENWMRKQT